MIFYAIEMIILLMALMVRINETHIHRQSLGTVNQ